MTPVLRRAADFERVLRTRSAASSAHFSAHHVGARPTRPPRRGPSKVASAAELSTAPVAPLELPGDERVVDGLWLGTVVPKRHARRAVTRSLLKRQIRSAMARHEGGLARGLWVVRLKAPFDRAIFVSAGSEQLRHAARLELDGLLDRAARSR